MSSVFALVYDFISYCLVFVTKNHSTLQIGWYNEQVKDVFRLSYPADTLGLLVISTPDMFERAFIPFLKNEECNEIRDPIDQCVVHYFNKVKQVSNLNILKELEIFHM